MSDWLREALPETVNGGMENDISEGQQKIENEPDLNHFDIGCLRETLHHRDQHAGQHQHYCQVHCQGGLKEERLEVVGDVSNDVEENSWDVYGGDDTQKSSAKPDLNYKVIIPNFYLGTIKT